MYIALIGIEQAGSLSLISGEEKEGLKSIWRLSEQKKLTHTQLINSCIENLVPPAGSFS